MEKVFAQVNIGEDITPTFHSYTTFGDFIGVIVRNVFVVAGIIALVFLVVGGFGVIMGAGSGESKQLEQGKKTITSAVIGLLIIFLSYWIVQILEIVTGQRFLNPVIGP